MTTHSATFSAIGIPSVCGMGLQSIVMHDVALNEVGVRSISVHSMGVHSAGPRSVDVPGVIKHMFLLYKNNIYCLFEEKKPVFHYYTSLIHFMQISLLPDPEIHRRACNHILKGISTCRSIPPTSFNNFRDTIPLNIFQTCEKYL
jgi:hypothetical protein